MVKHRLLLASLLLAASGVAAFSGCTPTPESTPTPTPSSTTTSTTPGPDATVPTADAGTDGDAGPLGNTACPPTNPLVRVSPGTVVTPVGTGVKRIHSAVVAGSDVYYATQSEIRKVSTTGQGETTFHESPGPLGHLAVQGTSLYFSDESVGRGGSVMSVPTAGGTATTVFPDVMLQGFEIEQYFANGNHFVMADVNGPSGKIRKLFRRTGAGVVEPVWARTTSFGFDATFTLIGDTFYVGERHLETSTRNSLLAVRADAPAITDDALSNPGAATLVGDIACAVVVGFGTTSPLWCIGPESDTSPTYVLRTVTATGAQVTRFSPQTHPASKGGDLILKIATDGDRAYVATVGAGEMNYAIYRVTSAGDVSVLACGLPLISDMTTGGSDLYVSFDSPTEQGKHGLYKMPR